MRRTEGSPMLGLLAGLLLFLTAGCDSVYYSKASVELSARRTEAVAGALEHVVESLEALDLQCGSTDYPILRGTYSGPQWSLFECRSRDHYVDVLIASSAEELAVEVHTIGGASEPQEFQQIRLESERLLREAIPSAELEVQYPYEPY